MRLTFGVPALVSSVGRAGIRSGLFLDRLSRCKLGGVLRTDGVRAQGESSRAGGRHKSSGMSCAIWGVGAADSVDVVEGVHAGDSWRVGVVAVPGSSIDRRAVKSAFFSSKDRVFFT